MDTVTEIELLKLQVDRIVSDIESEKGTRARSHAEMNSRITNVEQVVWRATGALMIVQIGITIMITYFLRK